MEESTVVTGTIAIVPARMGSRRLPGKVMLPLGQTTVLTQVIRRIEAAQLGAEIVVALPDGDEDQMLRQYCDVLGVPWYAGSETDIISRLLNTARYFEANYVLCCSGSDPLIHPRMLWASVRHAADTDLDLVTVGRMPLGSCGVAMPIRTLSRIDAAVTSPRQREQFLTCTLAHPHHFSRAILPPPPRLARHDLRLTLETEADYWFLRRIYEEVPPRTDGVLALEDVIAHIDRHNDLLRQSAHHYAVVRANGKV